MGKGLAAHRAGLARKAVQKEGSAAKLTAGEGIGAKAKAQGEGDAPIANASITMEVGGAQLAISRIIIKRKERMNALGKARNLSALQQAS